MARVTSLAQARLQREHELEALLAEPTGNDRARILPLVEAGTLGTTERFRLERQAELRFATSGKDAEIETPGPAARR